MNCPFCDPKEKVLKDNNLAYAMLSNPRKMPGHFLVIPKRHVEKPWELERDEVLDLFKLISFVEQRLVPAIAHGVDLRQHYRPFVKQSRVKVDHIHYQIVPRSLDDQIHLHNTEDEMWEDLTQDEHDRIAKLLE